MRVGTLTAGATGCPPTGGTTGGERLGGGALGAGALGAGVSPKMSPHESSSKVGGTTGAAMGAVGTGGSLGAGWDLALDELMGDTFGPQTE